MTHRARHHWPGLGLAAGFPALFACAPDTAQVDWTVRFEPEALSAQALVVSAWITRGGCAASERLYEADLSGNGLRAPTTLAPGTYGFAAEARDAKCRPFASGCVDRHLPSEADAPIELALSASNAAAHCSLERCRAGQCVREPLATFDAGSDAAPLPPLDASMTSGDNDGEDDAGNTHSDASSAEAVDATMAGSRSADAALGDGAGGDCPGGVRRPDGHCYRDLGTSMTFLEGRERCDRADGKLLVFDSGAEELWVTTTFAPMEDFWLGMTDVLQEGLWLTESLTFPSYSNWERPNPDGGPSYNCARYHIATGAWRDGSCFSDQRVICELP